MSLRVCVYAPIRLNQKESGRITKPRNALQAVLERQARTVVEPPDPEAPGRAGDPVATTAAALTPKFTRPSGTGRKLIAGHFIPARRNA